VPPEGRENQYRKTPQKKGVKEGKNVEKEQNFSASHDSDPEVERIV